MVAILLYVFALICLFDIWLVLNLDGWIIATLLILLFIPVVGDVTIVCIIIYWILHVKTKSQLLPRFHMLK